MEYRVLGSCRLKEFSDQVRGLRDLKTRMKMLKVSLSQETWQVCRHWDVGEEDYGGKEIVDGSDRDPASGLRV